jgi:hypothetical protein
VRLQPETIWEYYGDEVFASIAGAPAGAIECCINKVYREAANQKVPSQRSWRNSSSPQRELWVKRKK